MNIVLDVQTANGELPPVEYRWDTDTDILTAHLPPAQGAEAGEGAAGGEGMTGSVELAGNDGSWVILDVQRGSIRGIEVAVWPDVRKVPTLEAPAAEQARVHVEARRGGGKVQLLQVDTPLTAEADRGERTIHFSLGGVKAARVLRVARDVVLELDEHAAISGIWLTNVPPFPDDE